MKALVDGDIICYEVAFASEAAWKHEHAEKGIEEYPPVPWERVEILLTNRLAFILSECGAEGEPLLLFTGKGNFRTSLAFTATYKERPGEKPFHYYNVKAFLKSTYKYFEEDNLEADDLAGIFMTAYPDRYICCSRDKDLKQIPGWHYGWEVNKQPSFGPELVDEIGYLMLSSNRKKVLGVGAKFHHFQMLTGDSTDTIPGVPGYGIVTAFNVVNPCNTIAEMEEAVSGVFKKVYGLYWLDRMREVGRLTYMTRKRKGNDVLLYSPSFDKTAWINLTTRTTTVLDPADEGMG